MLEKYFKMYKEKLTPKKEDKKAVWSRVEKEINPSKGLIFGFERHWKVFLIFIIFVSIIGFGFSRLYRTRTDTSFGKIDDWQYSASKHEYLNLTTVAEDLASNLGFLRVIILLLFIGIILTNLGFAIYLIVSFIKRLNSKREKIKILPSILGSIAIITITTSILAYLGKINPTTGLLLIGFVLGIANLISIIYILSNLLIALSNKIRKLKIKNFWKKLGLGFAGLWQGAFVPFIGVFLALLLLGSTFQPSLSTPSGGGVSTLYSPSVVNKFSLDMGTVSEESIGYSTGGAKDINNFRANIQNNYLPLPTDITYEGLFYDYYFDRGQTEKCDKLFCPSYNIAVSADPFSNEEEYFMSVGLNSNIKESDFARKKLNLVIVLDISGSMGYSFNQYYYDQFGNKQEIDTEDPISGKSKMQIANESVVALLDHLNEDDRFGMVLFDDNAYVAKPLRLVDQTDMESIKDHILEIQEQGSTNMEDGMKKGTQLFENYLNVDQTEYENRIIFLTDAMPNIGDTSEEGLLGMTKTNANNKIYTTFIGIGVDFNTELIEEITKIQGANYYSVHYAKEFKERMDEGFEYMVTPLVFNLEMNLEAQGYGIEKVYGSPEADEATGQIMNVNTLFPSKTEAGETKGGIILLQLKKTSASHLLKLTVSYEDREGNKDTSSKTIEFGEHEAEYFENSGVRKAILLSRYVNLIKNWINDEREGLANNETIIVPCIDEETGIPIPVPIELGEWERQSVELQVADEYNLLFSEFLEYFNTEMDALGDDTLSQEADILEKLMDY